MMETITKEEHYLFYVCRTIKNKKVTQSYYRPEVPKVSRKLRFPDYVTMAQDGGKVVSLMHWQLLPPGNTPGTHIC